MNIFFQTSIFTIMKRKGEIKELSLTVRSGLTTAIDAISERSDAVLEPLADALYDRLYTLWFDRSAFAQAFPGLKRNPLGIEWDLRALKCRRIPNPEEREDDLIFARGKLVGDGRVTQSTQGNQLFVLPHRRHSNAQGREERGESTQQTQPQVVGSQEGGTTDASNEPRPGSTWQLIREPDGILLQYFDGATTRLKAGTVPWALLLVLNEQADGQALEVAHLAKQVDIIMSTVDSLPTSYDTLTGDQRHRQMQPVRRKGGHAPIYDGEPPEQLIERFQSALRTIKDQRFKDWRAKFLRWNRKGHIVTLSRRA